ncbi:MAG TPA: hypothetical protein VFY10_10575, partial [Dehalococcoidia bacterium]|nr:hypothetical protein [Dehalococcoidia bacterium]
TNTPTGSYAVSIPVTAPNDNPVTNCTQYVNNVTITNGGGTSNANDSASDPMTVVCPGQAVLSIVKSGDTTVTTGDAVNYSLTVTNTSGLGANGVVITDDLPNSLTNVTATYDVDPTTAGGTGSCSITDANLVTCNVGALAASDGNTASPEADVVQVTISATVPGCATFTNQATVTYSTDGSALPPTVVNSNIVTTNVNCGSITIVKNAVPNSTQDFGFTGDLGAFTLDDDGNNNNGLSNTSVFNNLTVNSYAVTENLTAGWLTQSITCSDGSTTSVVTRSAIIQLSGGEDVTCTFVNVPDPGTPPFTPPVTPVFVPQTTTTTTAVTSLPLVSQVQSAVTTRPSQTTTQPGLISEVESARSLPNTGSGGYLDSAGKSAPAGWLGIVLAAAGVSFLLLRVRRGARR